MVHARREACTRHFHILATRSDHHASCVPHLTTGGIQYAQGGYIGSICLHAQGSVLAGRVWEKQRFGHPSVELGYAHRVFGGDVDVVQVDVVASLALEFKHHPHVFGQEDLLVDDHGVARPIVGAVGGKGGVGGIVGRQVGKAAVQLAGAPSYPAISADLYAQAIVGFLDPVGVGPFVADVHCRCFAGVKGHRLNPVVGIGRACEVVAQSQVAFAAGRGAGAGVVPVLVVSGVEHKPGVHPRIFFEALLERGGHLGARKHGNQRFLGRAHFVYAIAHGQGHRVGARGGKGVRGVGHASVTTDNRTIAKVPSPSGRVVEGEVGELDGVAGAYQGAVHAEVGLAQDGHFVDHAGGCQVLFSPEVVAVRGG